MAKKYGIKTVETITTILGPETSLSGSLRFSTSLMIRGHFEGDITAQGSLFIADTADVKAGSIKVQNIYIAGTVSGDIEASDKIEMQGEAKVRGNIRTAKLRMADGVLFEGNCEMLSDSVNFDPFAQQT
ncbi:MAG: polymer-forming cytoskeletal protein [Spirochaetes bacterium]|nr:polymer-forming cytoskeletal protein [Spirochaetota bacterium]MBU0955820.1 polymer-forming cytoskeletal protein [Spirochaetota bacterium]